MSKDNLRPVKVGDIKGYFHCWSHEAVYNSNTGLPVEGTETYAIIEDNKGTIIKVEPYDIENIQFLDRTSANRTKL